MKLKAFNWRWLLLLVAAISLSATVAACGDDDDEPGEESGSGEHDRSICGEWVSPTHEYLYDYYYFDGDGTGIHGSYEPDIDWVNEDDDITWHTVDDKYLYIDGAKYEYRCDGSELEIQFKSGTRIYYEKG